ncbi:DUF937 domain-containing protein [Enemella evansiae]|uniref:DUF937 domain-containing protein n=1 Tax=Enemella evansiae TaxID=2016499 RepID=UPI000B95FCA9|nr:DUF937 domain-containing protein [Enemella evansiae]OYO06389.1 hypothetical protein CGZ97_07110 [Enemella evansiae]
MDEIDQLLAGVSMDTLATRVGGQPQAVAALSRRLVGALIVGMAANADQPGGERPLALALQRHADPELTLDRVDPQQGLAIIRNVFGGNTDAVAHTLAREFAGGDLALVRRLGRLLAPLVLARLGARLRSGPNADRLGPILAGYGSTPHGRGAGRPHGEPGLSDFLLELGDGDPDATGPLDESIEALSGLLGEGRRG